MQSSVFWTFLKIWTQREVSCFIFEGWKSSKGSKFNTFFSRAAAFLTAGTTMWQVGELLHTALSLFRELRKLAEDVAGSHTDSNSFLLFEFGEIIQEEKLWIQFIKKKKKPRKNCNKMLNFLMRNYGDVIWQQKTGAKVGKHPFCQNIA